MADPVWSYCCDVIALFFYFLVSFFFFFLISNVEVDDAIKIMPECKLISAGV